MDKQRALLRTLEIHLERGDIIALRDLAKLYQKDVNNREVLKLLKRFTLFQETEWDWEDRQKQNDFLAYFYQHSHNLSFSELLHTFYLRPIENWKENVQLTPKQKLPLTPSVLRAVLQQIDLHLKEKNRAALIQQIHQIGHYNQSAVHAILSKILDKKELYAFKKREMESIIVETINQLPDSVALGKILSITKAKKLDLSFCLQQLTNISNNWLPASNHENLARAYADLWLSFNGKITALKEYGYQKSNLTNPLFFKEKVDYFGWLAATSPDSMYWIQRNAIIDLELTRHPKSLFYLAGLNFRYWKTSGENHPILLNKVIKNIDVAIKVKENQSFTTQPLKAFGQEKLLNYWSLHYDDYEWDKYAQKFVNQQFFSEEITIYDRYFRRLNSTNDSIAQMAFNALCTGKPNEIQQLIKKFKPLLRNYNAGLPPLKYKILEQLSLLVHFCVEQQIPYLPNEKLKPLLNDLAQLKSQKERWELENQILKMVNLNDLTALEYFASLNAQNLPLNFSMGRILDYAYSNYLPQILKEEQQLRLYLLKIQLYKNFGGFGVCKKYAQKIDIKNPIFLRQISTLRTLETNNHILESIHYFLNRKGSSRLSQQISQFLAAPNQLNKEGVKGLPPFSTKEVPQIIESLFLQTDRKSTQRIGNYLELYASTEMTPQLFEMSQVHWTANKYAGIALVKVLEKIYHFSFTTKKQESISKWWKLWNTMSGNFTDWSLYLFRQQLERIRTTDDLTINDLNSITQSKYYESTHRDLCLRYLDKIKKTRTIYRLQISPKLSVKNELYYLKGIPFSTKELGNLPKLFKIDDAELLFNFIFEAAKEANVEQQSALYQSLFRQDWFLSYVISGKIEKAKNEAIQAIYNQYLAESSFLTEYEEQTTQLNLIHLENAFYFLKEKLRRISQDSLNGIIRYNYLSATLSRIEFSEIPIAFPILKEMSILDKNLFQFLNRDFGLPIFSIEEEQKTKEIYSDLKNLNEYEFYKKTLGNFGLPILKKSGKLDFQNIHQLLTYDLVVPFLGDGGKYRDFYTYGLVKLLELHFKTTLDFHPKLNENQTFYTFNAAKRVDAWRAYLLEQGLVSPLHAPSFN